MERQAGKEERYTTTVTYSEEKRKTETTEYTMNGEMDGSYRLVLASIAHVFAVVTYDVATAGIRSVHIAWMTIHTGTLIILQTSSPKFDDNENGVLS